MADEAKLVPTTAKFDGKPFPRDKIPPTHSLESHNRFRDSPRQITRGKTCMYAESTSVLPRLKSNKFNANCCWLKEKAIDNEDEHGYV